jgi:hypothetical protein
MVEVIKNGRRCSFCRCDVGNDALTSMGKGIYMCVKCCKEKGPASVKFFDGRLLNCLAKLNDKQRNNSHRKMEKARSDFNAALTIYKVLLQREKDAEKRESRAIETCVVVE